nr:MAG TPA: hypothetical protein [Caudoviricetes sp.]
MFSLGDRDLHKMFEKGLRIFLWIRVEKSDLEMCVDGKFCILLEDC